MSKATLGEKELSQPFGERGRRVQGFRLDVTLLPLSCLTTDQEFFLSSSKKILEPALLPEVRRLATSAAVPSPWGTEASRGFERPSSSNEKSSLPLPTPCQHCAVTAIMRRRQLEKMWSSVLAGSRRILCVKSGGRCSWGSSTRVPGVGGAVLSASHPGVSRGGAKGDGVTHRRGPRRGGLPAPIAYSRSRDALTRSMATKRAQVRDGDSVMANDVRHETWDALERPTRAFAAPV